MIHDDRYPTLPSRINVLLKKKEKKKKKKARKQETLLNLADFILQGKLEDDLIDLYQTAAMLSLRRIKSFVFLHGNPRTEFAYGRGLPCENKAFYSSDTQNGRRKGLWLLFCWTKYSG